MRRYDANTIDRIGISGMTLMERAALKVKDEIFRMPDGRRESAGVLIMAGTGNNGGDGLALARLLSEEGVPVDVWCVGEDGKYSEQWTLQRNILEYYEINFCDEPVSDKYDVLVDALFGVGLSREITGIYARAIETFNGVKGYKIAVDMPSGICSDTGRVLGCAVRADLTVTFGFAKRGLYMYPGCEYAGTVKIADIGINSKGFFGRDPEMFCIENERELINWMPHRAGDGNKGTFGKLLLVAGAEGMAGAAVLGARAAYRVGAGMVKVITDKSNRVIVQQTVSEAMYGDWQSDLNESMKWADVIAIGPGLGRKDAAMECLRTVIDNSDKPLLIDADGLNLLSENRQLQEKLALQDRIVIITPHVGEMSRLTGIPVIELKKDLWRHGMELASRLNCIVVAKDARTFICAGEKPVCINIGGNSGMATAGSGDVLAGVIAGILAQFSAQCGEDVQLWNDRGFRAACIGVRLHAAAGDRVAATKGEYACMAGDISEAISETLRNIMMQ